MDEDHNECPVCGRSTIFRWVGDEDGGGEPRVYVANVCDCHLSGDQMQTLEEMPFLPPGPADEEGA